MVENPLKATLPLVRVAASSAVGPFGYLISPILAALTIRVGESVGEESRVGRQLAEVLTHIFGHLSGDATKELFDSLREHGNHDLERATAAAIKAALDSAHRTIAAPDRILVDRFDGWFDLWRNHLDQGLKSPEATSRLFSEDNEIDPFTLAGLDEGHLWPLCETLLLRWANDQQECQQHTHTIDTSSLPEDLATHLAQGMPSLVRQAMYEVLRDKVHRRGWIAWQQRFLEAIASQIRLSNSDVAERLHQLAQNSEQLVYRLNDQFDRVVERLDTIQEAIRRDRRAEFPVKVGNVPAVLSPAERLRAAKHDVNTRRARSARASSTILIAGMSSPVPLQEVYRVLRLGRHEYDLQTTLTVDDVICNSKTSAVFFAPPGRGKSATLQHAFVVLARNGDALPLLYLLKEPHARRELLEVVFALKERGVNFFSKSELVLLIDGYDEIEYSDRIGLSSALHDLESVDHVRFILTCRTYYEVVSLPVDRYYLLPFTEADSSAFIEYFLKRDKAAVSAEELLREMKRRGFADFLGTPLFLALAAILQRGQKPQVPRNALRLLDEVIYYLTFQWDRERGVVREKLPNIDGRDLLACLKRIAGAFADIEGSQIIAEREVREHLAVMQNDKVLPHTLLLELARWFGIFVPAASGEWSFVHRTVHEYLAAKLMVESGQFSPDQARRNWRRAHYAACLVPDAGQYICQALRSGDELEMFVECCANDAYFSPVNVAHSLIGFYEQPKESCSFVHNQAGRLITVDLKQDYLDVVKSPFLHQWLDLAAKRGGWMRGPLISMALALSELRRRREPVSEKCEFYRFHDYQWHVTRSGLGGTVTFKSEDIRTWAGEGT
jgi:hypothetical protein